MRIFTPDAEAPFAGHPALGTAYIISHILEQDQTEQVILNLKAGQIPVIIGAEVLTMSQNEPIFGTILPSGTARWTLYH